MIRLVDFGASPLATLLNLVRVGVATNPSKKVLRI